MTTHEALWPNDLFEQGTGWVIVSRFKSSGRRVEAGIFLLDVFCLGVKYAVYESCDRQDYLHRVRGYYESAFPMVVVEPCRARKLIDQAIDYAQGLGFAPHSDYNKAARVLGGLDARKCTEHFIFGREGKPFYRRGPRETEAQAMHIVHHLERRCGADNFQYLVPLGESEAITRYYERTGSLPQNNLP